LKEIAALLPTGSTRELEMKAVEIETACADDTARCLNGKKLRLISIPARQATVLLDGVMEF